MTCTVPSISLYLRISIHYSFLCDYSFFVAFSTFEILIRHARVKENKIFLPYIEKHFLLMLEM